MNNIKLFESFVSEEDSSIYQAQEMASGSPENSDFDRKEWERMRNIKAGVYRTWINDYFIPMDDFRLSEEDPGLRALVSSAKAWLKKQSGITSVSKATGKQLTWTNGEILYRLYWEYRDMKQNRNKFPLMASMYDLIKGHKHIS